MLGVDQYRAPSWRLSQSTMRTSMSPSSPAAPVSVSVSCNVLIAKLIFPGGYDGAERCPKLLPCSHTVCVSCLKRIIATDARELGFRFLIVTPHVRLIYDVDVRFVGS